MWFQKVSSGITEEHSSFSCVTCGVCDFSQVLSPLCAQHLHHANGNNAWVLSPVRMNGGNPRKAFSLTLDKSQLLWALSLQSQHSPGKSPKETPWGLKVSKELEQGSIIPTGLWPAPGLPKKKVRSSGRAGSAIWKRGTPRLPQPKPVGPSLLCLQLPVRAHQNTS